MGLPIISEFEVFTLYLLDYNYIFSIETINNKALDVLIENIWTHIDLFLIPTDFLSTISAINPEYNKSLVSGGSTLLITVM